jgi:hypothetical protein
MTDDSRFFLAKTAEHIGRVDDAARMICEIACSGAQLTSEHCAFFSRIHGSLFQSKHAVLQNMYEQVKAPDTEKYNKAIGKLRATIHNEVSALHLRFQAVAKERFLSGKIDTVERIRLLKQMGDSFGLVESSLTPNMRSNAMNEAVLSYEKAVKLADQEFGSFSVDYLKCVLNWTAFQYQFGNKEEGKRLLFKTYSRTMAQSDSIPDENQAEIGSILRLMERNMGCWSREEEEENDNQS